jgi:hypothetical protein
MLYDIRKLIGKLNETTRAALEAGAGLCVSRTHYSIEIEHMLLRLLDDPQGDVFAICRHFDVNMGRLRAEIERALDRLKAGNSRTPAFGETLMRGICDAWMVASVVFEEPAIRSGFLLYALLESEQSARMLREISRELDRIQLETLKRDFGQIVSGSAERTLTPAPAPAARQRSGPPRVFLSYRRRDADVYAAWLFARLQADIPGIPLFIDVDTLRPGVDFTRALEETVGACDVLVAIIGKRWLAMADREGRRKLDDELDWVRREIAVALERGKLVIPCLVNGARMPRPDELPADVSPLATRQAFAITAAHFRGDSDQFVKMIRNLDLSFQPQAAATAPQS